MGTANLNVIGFLLALLLVAILVLVFNAGAIRERWIIGVECQDHGMFRAAGQEFNCQKRE